MAVLLGQNTGAAVETISSIAIATSSAILVGEVESLMSHLDASAVRIITIIIILLARAASLEGIVMGCLCRCCLS